MTDNPFINYWIWYYDVLWRYWPIVVLLTIISMWLIHRRYSKRESLHEASNLINIYKEDKDGWHKSTDIPCPGSLIVCEDGKAQLYFGYAVAKDGNVAMLRIPNWIRDHHKPMPELVQYTVQTIPVALFRRWQYIERRILPVETLGTYEQQYKEP